MVWQCCHGFSLLHHRHCSIACHSSGQRMASCACVLARCEMIMQAVVTAAAAPEPTCLAASLCLSGGKLPAAVLESCQLGAASTAAAGCGC
ncbi:hypothetical protein COO60DRAFT_1282939 [Scenedesmus sp. NREL 46B-D3]|nr:hypothetical protein COO60DRAFT_1282939 [Scenedesmus sp. NREL 46B-D3]